VIPLPTTNNNIPLCFRVRLQQIGSNVPSEKVTESHLIEHIRGKSEIDEYGR